MKFFLRPSYAEERTPVCFEIYVHVNISREIGLTYLYHIFFIFDVVLRFIIFIFLRYECQIINQNKLILYIYIFTVNGQESGIIFLLCLNKYSFVNKIRIYMTTTEENRVS